MTAITSDPQIALNLAATFVKKKETLCKLLPDGRIGAYLCPAGVPTIGWGTTVYSNGQKVSMRDVITLEKAEFEFMFNLKQFQKDVRFLVTIDINPHMEAALISFAYNVGSDIDLDQIPEGLGDSTLLKKINANPLDPTIESEFKKWTKAWVKDDHGTAHLCILPGLVIRREEEFVMYNTKIAA